MYDRQSVDADTAQSQLDRPANPLVRQRGRRRASRRVRNISISDVTIENVDPRYPVLLAGLVDHPIENVYIGNVSIQYRGGLKMEHAIEQRQLNQS